MESDYCSRMELEFKRITIILIIRILYCNNSKEIFSLALAAPRSAFIGQCGSESLYGWPRCRA